MKLLTNLIFEPKGMHDPALAYNIKDTVMSTDGSRVYFALQDVPAGTALDNEDYWKLQIDLSSSKSAMDQALASFADYAEVIGTRVRGETAKASGNPAAFLPDAGSLLRPVTVLDVQQQGAGDPSPENIRPFIGYNKLDLYAAGKNLAPRLVPGTVNGVAFTVNEDGSVHVSGTASAETARFVDFYLPAGSYIISGAPAGSAFAKYDVYIVQMPETGDNGTVIARSFDGSTVTHFTIDKYSRMRLVVRIPAGTVDSTKVFHPMIRLASITDAGYIPHNAKLHTVQIGETVYGGKLDWLMGKLVAEWAVYTVTGEEQLNVFPDNPGTCNRFGVILPEALTDNTETLCSHFHLDTVRDWAYSASDVDAYYGVYRITSGYVRFILPAKTLSEAQTLLAAQNAAGTPIQIAYKLKTPIEIQLSPTIISAADPEQANTLYGDGVIEVEYVKPLHVSIEEHVAAAMQTE